MPWVGRWEPCGTCNKRTVLSCPDCDLNLCPDCLQRHNALKHPPEPEPLLDFVRVIRAPRPRSPVEDLD